MNIPNEAVEAAFTELPDGAGVYVNRDDLRVILDAAAPHMFAKLTAEVAYQKACAAYFKYAPEFEYDPEGVRALADEMRRLRGSAEVLEVHEGLEGLKDFQPHPTKPGVWIAPEAGTYRLPTAGHPKSGPVNGPTLRASGPK